MCGTNQTVRLDGKAGTTYELTQMEKGKKTDSSSRPTGGVPGPLKAKKEKPKKKKMDFISKILCPTSRGWVGKRKRETK